MCYRYFSISVAQMQKNYHKNDTEFILQYISLQMKSLIFFILKVTSYHEMQQHFVK